jgi:redox-sensitive bicupin YhaK (pirin superfamily)
MRQLRRAQDRGHFDFGWLNTYHTFSFGHYYDPNQMHFRALRVMNEDRVQPGQGFGEHGHDNMEIVTYVLAGALAHRDSLGNGSTLRPGELQRMSAGTGIRHSEFNPSDREPAHFYQIWLFPAARDTAPSYEQKSFAEAERRGRWRLVASPTGDEGSLTIGQDARIYLSLLEAGTELTHTFAAPRHGWLQILRGAAHAGDVQLAAGDGLAISDEPSFGVIGSETAELLLFDLA